MKQQHADNTFTTTGGTSHSRTLTGLTDGQSYTYYVRCIDGSGNANTNDYTISFSVAAAPVTCASLSGTCKSSPCSSYGSCTSLGGTCTAGYCCSGSCTTLGTCDNLEALYHFDGNAQDSANSHDGTINGATYTTSGKFNGAYSFDGSDDIIVPDFSYGNQYTMSFWFNAPTGNVNPGYIISHGEYNSADSVNCVIDSATDAVLSCVRDSDDISCGGTENLDAGPVKGTGWHNAVVTVASGLSSIYLDGNFVESVARGGDTSNPTTDFFIGERSNLDPNRLPSLIYYFMKNSFIFFRNK